MFGILGTVEFGNLIVEFGSLEGYFGNVEL